MKQLKDILNEAFLIKKHQAKSLHEYIDLDLPSGNLWASCNIGANTPEDEGLLFQFGRTDGYRFDDNNHKFLSVKDYTSTSGKKYVRGEELNKEDDAAYQITNGKAVIPKYEDFDELFEYCDYKYTQLKGVDGMLISSKKNKDSSIFFPITHTYIASTEQILINRIYLWTSLSNNDNAFHFSGDDYGYCMIGYHKYNANPIRPIKK